MNTDVPAGVWSRWVERRPCPLTISRPFGFSTGISWNETLHAGPSPGRGQGCFGSERGQALLVLTGRPPADRQQDRPNARGGGPAEESGDEAEVALPELQPDLGQPVVLDGRKGPASKPRSRAAAAGGALSPGWGVAGGYGGGWRGPQPEWGTG